MDAEWSGVGLQSQNLCPRMGSQIWAHFEFDKRWGLSSQQTCSDIIIYSNAVEIVSSVSCFHVKFPYNYIAIDFIILLYNYDL